MTASDKLVACIGGVDLDRKYYLHDTFIKGTSNPANGDVTLGGVAQNVAANLALLDVSVCLAAIAGKDHDGQLLMDLLDERDINTDLLQMTEQDSTAEYVAVIGPDGDMVLGVAKMNIFDLFTPEHLAGIWDGLSEASWIFADCNLPAATLSALLDYKQNGNFYLVIDAVSIPKVMRLPDNLSGVDLVFMNLDEANAYLQLSTNNYITDERQAAKELLKRNPRAAIVTNGNKGVGIATESESYGLDSFKVEPVDTTGAGDALIAGTIYGLHQNDDIQEAARTGLLMAALTAESHESVRSDLSTQLLEQHYTRLADEETGD